MEENIYIALIDHYQALLSYIVKRVVAASSMYTPAQTPIPVTEIVEEEGVVVRGKERVY